MGWNKTNGGHWWEVGGNKVLVPMESENTDPKGNIAEILGAGMNKILCMPKVCFDTQTVWNGNIRYTRKITHQR